MDNEVLNTPEAGIQNSKVCQTCFSEMKKKNKLFFSPKHFAFNLPLSISHFMYQVACLSLTWLLDDLNTANCYLLKCLTNFYPALLTDFYKGEDLVQVYPKMTRNNKKGEHTIITECLNLQTFLEHIPFSHNSQVISFPNAAGWCL